MATPPNRMDTSGKPVRAGQGNSIAAGGKLEGKFHFTGPVIIGAHLRGDVETDDLIVVEATGKVEGRIRAATLIVHGAVSGDIEASRALEVCVGGRLEGVAYSPSMRVEERTFVSADLLIAPERSVVHINKAASVPDLSNVAPLTAGRSEPVATDTAEPISAAG